MSKTKLLLLLGLGVCVSEVLFLAYSSNVYDLIFMTIPYGIVYVYGLNIDKFNKLTNCYISIMLLLACVLYGIYASQKSNCFVGTFLFKYPPQFYYVSYGMGISLLLWVFRKNIEKVFDALRISSFMKYVGKHTYWLYLWHIPMVDIVGNDFCPVIRFFIIFSVSLTMVSLQYLIVKKYVSNKTLMTIFNG